MYDQSSVLIAAVLFAGMVVAINFGFAVGRRNRDGASDAFRAQINAIQGSLLGVLALVLGFTFSLALQRFDKRSDSVVDEANAIGTAMLRASLLPSSERGRVQPLLREYAQLRVQAGSVTLAEEAKRVLLLQQAQEVQRALWAQGLHAAEVDGRPVSSGLFIQSLNDLIDAFGRRNAALTRHVPEPVLLLLFGTFLLTGSIVGYASGVAGNRTSFVTYVLVALIVLLVFVIIDLDRPRRGLIEVDQSSLAALVSQVVGAESSALPDAP